MELAVLAFVLFFYLLPTIIGFYRGHSSKWGILAMNLFLGWTVLFWLWAFIWSLSNKGGSQNVSINNFMNNHNGNS